MKLKFALLGIGLLALGACGLISDPFRAIKAADTPDQQAFAIQGTYVAYQRLAVDLVELPVCGPAVTSVCIHQIVKTAIQDAAAISKPASDAVAVAGQSYQDAKAVLDAAPEDATKIEAFQRALEAATVAIDRAKPLVDMLKSVVDTAKDRIDKRRAIAA